MKHSYIQAACAILAILQSVMLLALFAQTPPHPPLEVAPFALGPFLGVAVAIAVAACMLTRESLSTPAKYIAILAAVLALVSFGPQKYIDPAFDRIWPAVITAQLAIVVVFVLSFRKTTREV